MQHCLRLSTLFTVATIIRLSTAETRAIDLILPATSTAITYENGVLLTPGSVDLRPLTFTTLADAAAEDSIYGVDIAAFHLPNNCSAAGTSSTSWKCDWTKLGLGGKTDDDITRYCCDASAVEWGLCVEDFLGRLIVQRGVFRGLHKYIEMSSKEGSTERIDDGLLEFDKSRDDLDAGSGQYVVVFANCNEVVGRDVRVSGDTIWKSANGYLPNELQRSFRFYLVMVPAYMVLLFFFGARMVSHGDVRVGIEKYILATIILGTTEMVCHSVGLFVWNIGGQRPKVWMYLGVLVSVLKHTAILCLVFALCCGWLTFREPDRRCVFMMIGWGTMYSILLAVKEASLLFFIEKWNEMKNEQEDDMINTIWLLTVVIAFWKIMFGLLIIWNLCHTIFHLRRNSQTHQLRRYRVFIAILVLSSIFRMAVGVVSFIHQSTEDAEGIQNANDGWASDAANQITCLFILTSAAVLWRPSAQQYELATRNQDENADEQNLELTGNVLQVVDEQKDDWQNEGEDQVDKRFEID